MKEKLVTLFEKKSYFHPVFQFILIGHKILFLGGCILYLCDSTVKEIGCIDKPRSSNGGICCPKNGGIINTKHIWKIKLIGLALGESKWCKGKNKDFEKKGQKVKK